MKMDIQMDIDMDMDTAMDTDVDIIWNKNCIYQILEWSNTRLPIYQNKLKSQKKINKKNFKKRSQKLTL